MMILPSISFSFTFTSLLYLLLTYLSFHFLHTLLRRTTHRLPPGPFPLPIVGNLLSLGNKPHQSLAALSKHYGPVISLRLGSLTTVVVSSVSAAEEVLKKKDVAFSNRHVQAAVASNGHNEVSVVFMPPGPRWRNLRKICNSYVFSTSRLDESRDLRLSKVTQLLSHVEKCSQTRTPVNIGLAAFSASLNLLSNTFFSTDLAGDSTSKASRELKDLIWSIVEEVGKPNIADYLPWLKPVDPQGVGPRIKGLIERQFKVFDEMINPRLEMRRDYAGIKKEEDRDVLDVLLSISEGKESTEAITLKEIKHLLSDLFTAGTDTTSSTIEWVMAELLHNPSKLQTTQSEIRHFITSNNRSQLEESDIPNLPYLQAVVKETLRLHPPTPLLIPRKLNSDESLSGYTVPKNAQVFVNVWAMGRDPSVWGKDAAVFEPERFVGSRIDYKGTDFELIPFGAGRRICPGLVLAHRMIHLVIGSLLNEFDWELPGELTPEGLNMDDKFGLTLQRAESLLAIPVKVCHKV